MATIDTGSGGGSGDRKGMDDARVKDIAGRLQKAKADLATAKSDADAAAQRLQGAWVGPDATRFQGQWKKESNNIDQCVLDVTAMVKSLNADIAEQRATSN
jgi:uncharacterized protein YukE